MIVLNIGLSIVGFVLLIKCADVFVNGAVALAKNFKVSTTVIGLTVVAFGTSAPELAISFNSHLTDNHDLLYGSVIGSNIANIFLILGFAVLIRPFKINGNIIQKEIPILLLITLAFATLFIDTRLARSDGVILLLFFAIFVYYLITVLKDDKKEAGQVDPPKYKRLRSIIMVVLGLTGIVLGSNLIVDNVSAFAATVGVSQKIIAVTVVAVGTSLPELVTTITAARKGENNMAIGNIVGSNIFNICVVLGLPVIMLGEASTVAFGIVDLAFLLGAVVLLWIFAATNRELKRHEGVILMVGYAAYTVYVLMQ